MVDLTKHLDRAAKAIKGRNYDLAIQVCLECQEVDPGNIDNYKVLLDAARRRAKEGGKKSLFGRLGVFTSKLSKDPNKRLTAAVKALSSGPDEKSLVQVGNCARDVFEASKVKHMADAAIFFYEEVRRGGLFNEQVLWNIGHMYHARFNQSKEPEFLEKAIAAVAELRKNNPSHPDAGRTLQNWEALRSMTKRVDSAGGGDYRSQLASDDSAKKNEVMGRIIRTREDAEEVLAFVDGDLKEDPKNKQLWQKKGDVLKRINEFERAQEAFEQAVAIDTHDFNLQIQVGDCKIALAKQAVEAAKRDGGDESDARKALMELEIAEYRKRIERQPTEGCHRYHLGVRLFHSDDIDGAATELQKAVGDARFKRQAHRYLGMAFVKKGLNDLAIDQFSSYLAATDDDHDAEAKDVLYNRARLLEQAGKADQAKADYRHLVEIDFQFKDAADRLGKL
jgi:tetratricopeptide (TPR) repeat protein